MTVVDWLASTSEQRAITLMWALGVGWLQRTQGALQSEAVKYEQKTLWRTCYETLRLPSQVATMGRELATKYGWDAFENSFGNERPPSNHLPIEADQKQRSLLRGPKTLLQVFRRAATHHAQLGQQWSELARQFTIISDTCETHKLGCNNVAPPRQAQWMNDYRADLARWARDGPSVT